MTKSLREVLEPKAQAEKDFVKKHKIEKTADKAGNGDDVFTGSNVKKAAYPAQAASAYEEVVKEDYADIEADSYDTHHKRCTKALSSLQTHVDNHKKWSKGTRGSEEMKNLSRSLEDMAHNFAHTADWMKPMKVKTQ